jgi:tRNA dimethylallyltransferase
MAEPTDKFSVAAYLEAVRPAFESGREVIVAGGTGLYVKCLTEGFDDVPPENAALRDELEALDVEALARRARQNAPERYNSLTEDDRQNPRRLIRILEKVSGGTSSPASVDSGDAFPPKKSWNSKPKPILVGLHVERAELHERIARRVDQMYAGGLLDEARTLIGLDLSPTALQAIGYAEAFAVLRNEMTSDEARERTVIRTRQLAKRQMTWFRNQLNVEWIDTGKYPTLEKMAEAVSAVWRQTGPTPIVI